MRSDGRNQNFKIRFHKERTDFVVLFDILSGKSLVYDFSFVVNLNYDIKSSFK